MGDFELRLAQMAQHSVPAEIRDWILRLPPDAQIDVTYALLYYAGLLPPFVSPRFAGSRFEQTDTLLAELPSPADIGR